MASNEAVRCAVFADPAIRKKLCRNLLGHVRLNGVALIFEMIGGVAGVICAQ